MGRLLGSHDSDTLDRPDLNQCPECGSYFASTSEYCPICSAFCSEEYRAGNRKPVKAKKQTFVVLVRDCIREDRMNLLPGDTVVFYGEGAGTVSLTDTQYVSHTAPCIYAAYAVLDEEVQP